jgi:formate-dependent nitrite reductase membrane component NrfD
VTRGATLTRPGRAGAAHEHARDAYKDVPILQPPTWNNDIAAYFFLGGVSSGAFLLGALLDAGGTRTKRASLARTARIVSFAAMLPCPALLIDDLGTPSRFHHMLRIFKPSSPMSLGSWALTAHGAFATLIAARQLAATGKLPLGGFLTAIPERVLTLGGFPTALTLGGYTGVLLGTTSIPVWSTSPLLGGLFMASALNTGVAATVATSVLTGNDDPGDHAMLGPFTIALGCSEIALLGGFLATSGRAARPLLHGREALLLAGAVAGSVAAVALDSAAMRAPDRARRLNVIGAIAALIGGACLRWGIVRAGHVSAADREGTLAATKPARNAPGWGPS